MGSQGTPGERNRLESLEDSDAKDQQPVSTRVNRDEGSHGDDDEVENGDFDPTTSSTAINPDESKDTRESPARNLTSAPETESAATTVSATSLQKENGTYSGNVNFLTNHSRTSTTTHKVMFDAVTFNINFSDVFLLF